jgi:uncharacterized protein (TIGR02217 family)
MGYPFIEQRFHTDPKYGTSFSESYSVYHSTDMAGGQYSRLNYPQPLLRYELNYSNSTKKFVRDEIYNFYHRCGGTFAGFRLRHHVDYSTNDFIDEPTHEDQLLIPADAGPAHKKFQLVRWFGPQGQADSTRRILRKIVADSVLIGVNGVLQSDGYTVNHNTGVVEFASAPSAEAVVTGGCYFDIPVRFESDISGASFSTWDVIGLTLNVVEILNPS